MEPRSVGLPATGAAGAREGRAATPVRLDALTTRRRSPPWAGAAPVKAMRSMVPATGVVMLASIFMASIVATVSPAATVSPSARVTVTEPAKGAAMWPGVPGSAFSAALTSASMLRSRTLTGRICPLRVHMTVRMPFSSGSDTASRVAMSRTPFSSSMTCSVPACSP